MYLRDYQKFSFSVCKGLGRDSSAALRSEILGGQRGASLGHVFIGLDGRVAGVDHLVLAQDLTVGLVGIDLLAHSGLGEVLVEDVEGVHVARGELGAVDLACSEDTGGLVGSGDVGGANVGDAIAGLYTVVYPAVFFDHGQEIFHGLVSACSFTSNLLDIETLGAKSLVQSLSDKDISGVRAEILNQREQNWDKAGGKQRRPVVNSCVDPAEQEVVVSIWKTVGSPEEFLGSGFIELSTSLITQGHVRNVEVGIPSPDLPVRPLVSLDALVGPVPPVL